MRIEVGSSSIRGNHALHPALQGAHLGPRATVSPDPALRYVVLRHEGHGEPHFDVLFETHPGSVLASWRAERWPLSQGDYLTRGPDHDPRWLTYEGPVSGGRGEAWRVAAGTCRDVHEGDGLMEATFSDGVELTLVKDSPEHWFCCVVSP